MPRRLFIILAALAAIVALPISLRRPASMTAPAAADDTLVILTPHNDSICQEFGEAFAAYWRKSTGRALYVDWRNPGGISEIRSVLDAGFAAAQDIGREGIGIDVLFGGGAPDFEAQAKNHRLLPLDVFTRHPDWFAPDGPIPMTFTGESYYPPDHRWVGTCTSQFGICYNPDALERLHLDPPTSWRDLANPRYAGFLALADPTKSGSVARAFELLVQTEILRELARHPTARCDAAMADGWTSGLNLIQQLAANARYFTDSASKIPQDVGQGNAAAGMCIDFYGRSFAATLNSPGQRPRLVWLAPRGGTTLSADPVAVLQGAPHRELAQSFVEFLLTRDAQLIWFGKVGAPDGPQRRALYRTPIRRDVYSAQNVADSVIPEVNPYTDPGNFVYQAELTGGAFNSLRQIIKAMCIDSQDEMKDAWQALREAGMPADALTVFSDVSIIPYHDAVHGDPRFDSRNPLESLRRAADLNTWFRAHYRQAAAMARAAKKSPTP